MNKIREDLLIEMDRKGIIPGPKESWSEWERRVSFLSRQSSSNTSYPSVLELLEWHWGISPSWIEVEEKAEGFWPWHAASCDISEEGDVSIVVNPGAILFCSLDEILSHEMSHAARSSFDDGCFDEYLAYSLSSSWLRRQWGPFFSQKSWLPLLWVFSWFLPSCLFLIGALASLKISYFLIGSSWFAALMRHSLLQSRYQFAWNKLRKEFPEEIARWMFFRLSEDEVLSLADGQFSIKNLITLDQPRSKLFQLKINSVERI